GSCSNANRLGRLKNPPSRERAPAFKVSRRVRPSQQRRGLPKSVSIAFSPERALPSQGCFAFLFWHLLQGKTDVKPIPDCIELFRSFDRQGFGRATCSG